MKIKGCTQLILWVSCLGSPAFWQCCPRLMELVWGAPRKGAEGGAGAERAAAEEPGVEPERSLDMPGQPRLRGAAVMDKWRAVFTEDRSAGVLSHCCFPLLLFFLFLFLFFLNDLKMW